MVREARQGQGSYSLDHFLPWKFVLHDQLWNPIPVSRSANSSKSDSLPSLRYLEPFVETQCLGLAVARGQTGERKWKQVMESYSAGLRVPVESFDSGSQEAIQRVLGPAFESTLPPLISAEFKVDGPLHRRVSSTLVCDRILRPKGSSRPPKSALLHFEACLPAGLSRPIGQSLGSILDPPLLNQENEYRLRTTAVVHLGSLKN